MRRRFKLDLGNPLEDSLKVLTNQQKDGDSPVGAIVTGLLEKGRCSTMDELRKFTAVDSIEAVKVGDLHRETESMNVGIAKVYDRFRGNSNSRRRG